MNQPKWITRAGLMILVVGFFMPTMLVSCTGMSAVSQSFSLADLAGKAGQSALYMLPVGALVALGISFLSASQQNQALNYLWIQLGGVAAGVLGVPFSVLSLSGQFQGNTLGMFEIRPAFGALLLVAGMAGFLVGWLAEWQALKRSASQESHPAGQGYGASAYSPPAPPYPPTYSPHPSTSSTPPIQPPTLIEKTAQEGALTQDDAFGLKGAPYFPPFGGDRSRTFDLQQDEIPTSIDAPPSSASSARLDLLQYGSVQRSVPISCDDFTIGRGSDTQLRLLDSTVSRHHARLRLANGTWFIQDTDSAAGLFVNGQKVPAARLKSGDEIQIGEQKMRFYC